MPENNESSLNGTVVPTNGKDSWIVWQKLVLSDIERNEKSIKDLEEKFNKFEVQTGKDITALNIKAVIYGSLAGIVVSAILVALAEYLFKQLK